LKKIISLIICLVMAFSLSSCKKQEPVPPVPVEVAVTLTAVGDNLIHAPIYEQALLSDGSYDFAPAYANIANYIKGDINILNQ